MSASLTELSLQVPALWHILLRVDRAYPLSEVTGGGDGVRQVAEGRKLLGDVVHT